MYSYKGLCGCYLMVVTDLEHKRNVSRLLSDIMHSNETQFSKLNEKSLYMTAL